MDGLTYAAVPSLRWHEYDSSTGEGAVDDTEEVSVTNGTEQISDGLHPNFETTYGETKSVS